MWIRHIMRVVYSREIFRTKKLSDGLVLLSRARRSIADFCIIVFISPHGKRLHHRSRLAHGFAAFKRATTTTGETRRIRFPESGFRTIPRRRPSFYLFFVANWSAIYATRAHQRTETRFLHAGPDLGILGPWAHLLKSIYFISITHI